MYKKCSLLGGHFCRPAIISLLSFPSLCSHEIHVYPFSAFISEYHTCFFFVSLFHCECLRLVGQLVGWFVGCFRGLCSFLGLRDCNAKARFVQLGGLPRVLGGAQTKVGGLQSNPVCACSLGFLRTI